MANVIQFVPRVDLDAKKNLAAFIRLAREELTAFGGSAGWESDRWQEGRTVAVFATKTKPLTPYEFTPLADPYMQFAKAYVRYAYSYRPVASVAFWIQALRCIEAALLQVCGSADAGLINLAVMDVSAVKCKEFYQSADVWHKTGLAIARVFDFCREHHLVRSLPAWQSPFPKPVILTEDLGEAGKAHRAAKLPSNASMLALADLFCRAEDDEARFYSSIMILLMVAPGRISEVLQLPVDCIGWEEDARGVPQMYLRWWAAKGKGHTKKWIIPAMQNVVKEAVHRLTDIGAPARAAAKFAFDQPSEFMRHEGCLNEMDGDNDRALTPEEFCGALAFHPKAALRNIDGTPRWSSLTCGTKWIAELLSMGPVTYGKLAAYVHESYCGRFWPFIDLGRTVHAWESLCLHRENEFHREFAVKPFSWRIPTANDVNTRLESSHGRSLFERYAMKGPHGDDIKLTSHQLRHWLSTMSQRAGMDDYTLAQWAGRARAADNRHYDHRTAEERLNQAKDLLVTDKSTLLERFRNGQPITYRELGVDRLGVAKPTMVGLCVKEYADGPCLKFRQCMTCKEHVCIKGDFVTLDRIRRLEGQQEFALSRAEHERDRGTFGADRWVDSHKWDLANTKAMRETLEQPSIADGTPIRLPDGHDPSAVQVAMISLGYVDPPKTMPALVPVQVKAIPEDKDA